LTSAFRGLLIKRNEFFPPWSNDAKNFGAGLAELPNVVAVDSDRSGRLKREYGKQDCTLAVAQKGINRLAVGLGMIPPGEAGLIFAGIAVSLTLPDSRRESADRWSARRPSTWW